VKPSTAPRVNLKRTRWDQVRLVLLAAALAMLFYLVTQIVVALTTTSFFQSVSVTYSVLVALIVYLVAHGFRILRLGLLIGGWRVGLRTIASFHLMTAAVSAIFPLKLGEVYRVVELSSLAGSFVRAVLIVWWERVFDVAAIVVILTFAFVTTSPDAHAPFYAIIIASGAFILLTTVIFFVVPDNFRRLSLLIIRRYDSPRSVGLLRVLHAARVAIQEAPTLVRKKLPSLITLTALIWICEMTCFALLLPALTAYVSAAAEHLISFLSTITLGETLLTALHDEPSKTLLYFVATQGPLAVLGLGAGLAYAARRLKRGAA
jgi:Lysylphosphatidylglycerol synthase TM region